MSVCCKNCIHNEVCTNPLWRLTICEYGECEHFRDISDYRKQVEGEWETFPSIGNKYRCSLCKEKSEKRHKYCPNCGARMMRDEKGR